jgi:hypothetical protein
MSLANPTRLRIGMQGTFSGKTYRLVGRVVMGVEDGGEIYYWNEFNLEASDGSSATLVFEETERGGEWRLFTLFEPEYPMSAEDAATKRVGDRLNLTETEVHVTLRGTSRVYRIEGKAPEGVQVRQYAKYFNAEAGDLMQVVSWTGDEVEYYNGENLSRGVVETAFNLPSVAFSSLAGSGVSNWLGGSTSEDYSSLVKFAGQACLIVVIFLVIFGRSFSCSNDYEAKPVKKIFAGETPLKVNAEGRLQDTRYRLTAHLVVEIAETDRVWERHEYQLTDDDHGSALLVQGLKPNDPTWILFTPLSPVIPPSATESAARKLGERVNVDGIVANIQTMFLATVRKVDGLAEPDQQLDTHHFGYFAQTENTLLLVRWSERGISYQRGKTIANETVKLAFGKSVNP